MEPDESTVAELARKFALVNALAHGGRADQVAVIGRILSENANLRKTAPQVRELVQREVAAVNLLQIEAQRNALNSEFPGELEEQTARKKQISKSDSERVLSLPELQGASQGTFVARFPPEPNGYMHIGHAKAAILGNEYCKKYDGKFLIRFDDTNPAAEKKEYYEAFLESLIWLGVKADRIKNASDDMQLFYSLAEKLVLSSRAYVCDCEQEEMRKNRGLGIACSHRGQSKERNLLLWKKMLDSTKEQGSSTLRFVGDMQSLNTAMRDPVLFRTVTEPHPLKGSQYLVWPTYDFDGAVEDSVDGVTHALRSKEYELRDETYNAILDALSLRKPRIVEFSRLDLQNTTVSKRSLRKLIEEGRVKGWDDPRLPTIAGLRRRGFLPEAIREFVLSMGLSKVESQPTWDLLESLNRKLLDPIVRRYFFVSDPVQLQVENAPTLTVRLKSHPERDLGERVIQTNGKFLISREDASALRQGMKVRLMEAYNIEVVTTENTVKATYSGEENADRMKRLHWVVPAESFQFSVLVTGPLLLQGIYNPQSLRRIDGMIEEGARRIVPGEIVQFVRFGFCRLDSPQLAIMAHK